MRKSRHGERGFATLLVLILALALSLLLSVAIQAHFAGRRHHRRELRGLQRQADTLAPTGRQENLSPGD